MDSSVSVLLFGITRDLTGQSMVSVPFMREQMLATCLTNCIRTILLLRVFGLYWWLLMASMLKRISHLVRMMKLPLFHLLAEVRFQLIWSVNRMLLTDNCSLILDLMISLTSDPIDVALL